MPALILGILSIVLCWVPIVGLVLAIVALVVGVRRMRRLNEQGRPSGLELAGALIGGFGILSSILGTIVTAGAVAGMFAFQRHEAEVDEVRERRARQEEVFRQQLEDQQRAAGEALREEEERRDELRRRAEGAALEAEALRRAQEATRGGPSGPVTLPAPTGLVPPSNDPLQGLGQPAASP
jgi:uncharacterized membrane protein